MEEELAIERRRARSRMGAGRPASDAPASQVDSVELVVVLAAGAECALPLACVREIVEASTLDLRAAAAGDLRGTIMLGTGTAPVLDLGARLGAGETPCTRPACIIVLARAFRRALPLGLLVDAVRDLVVVPRADVVPAPRLGGTLGAFGAMARLQGRLLPVLEPDRVLTAEDERRAATVHGDAWTGSTQLQHPQPVKVVA